jgi:copper chaperone
MFLFHVPSMKCGGCLGAVTRALQAIDSAVRVEADLERREIRVTSSRFESALLSTLREAGYPAEPIVEHIG